MAAHHDGRSDAPVAGVLLLMLTIAMFVVMDTTIKYLTDSVPLFLMLWVRFGAHLVAMVLIMLARGRSLWHRPRRPGLQAARSLLLLFTSICFASGVHYLPLAEATAITFVSPLMLTVLAARMLGERVGALRWAAVLLGFAGVLVVIRPGLGVTHPAAALVVIAAVALALYQTLTRRIAGQDDVMTTGLHTALAATAVTTPIAPFVWVALPFKAWALMLMIGVMGAISHIFLIMAFNRAPASLLAPFVYTQLIWAAIAGWLVFGDIPDWATGLGAGVIAAAGLIVLHGERRARQARAAAAPG
ncbi:MAG: DMT family transporter [Alphaproteobacteria bacterium]|nr:DMT family transporter [Alphaproteobacteria bacterium]